MTQPGGGIQLFNRSSTVTVGPVSISNIGQELGLDVWFNVKRSLRPKQPNTADIRLYNLADARRKAIEAAAQPFPASVGPPVKPGEPRGTYTPVSIVAGYVGSTEEIFFGEMRTAQTVIDGPDTVLEMTTGDGDTATILSRISFSFGAGINAYVVAQKLCSSMGLGVGNIATVAAQLRSSPAYKSGVVLKGNPMHHLVDLAKSCGLEVSVHKGVAQWQVLGQPLGGQAYVISADTGMIGSPSVDTAGNLNFECLLIPGIKPGASVQMQATYVTGTYRIISVETTGDTSGNDWKHSVEARRPGTGLGS